MTPQEIIDQAKQFVVTFKRPFVMTTASTDGRPQSRWMGAFVLAEPFTLLLVTHARSRKVEHIRANAHVQLLFATEDFSKQVALSGVAELDNSPQTRSQVWAKVPAAATYFSGATDPNLMVIRVVTTAVELWTDRNQREPLVADLPVAAIYAGPQ